MKILILKRTSLTENVHVTEDADAGEIDHKEIKTPLN